MDWNPQTLQFAAPLWSIAGSISRKINGVGSVETLRQLLEARRLCCRIFYRLNYLGVAEELKDKEDEWMNEFKNYLTERYPDIKDRNCLSLVDEVRVAVCEILSNYMEKEREDKVLEKHLSYFVEAVWSLVVADSASLELQSSGMKFLSRCIEHGAYDEFLRKDMEGNGVNMTRRIDCELLKSQNKEKIRGQIQKWLSLFEKNPAGNWELKECAIYLVVSLPTTDVVDVESFFRSYIIPELQSKDVNAFPMLKAAALNFFTVFRFLIPKHVAIPLFGDVVRYVGSDWRMVHSYAAICIEKLLLLHNKNGVVKFKDALCNDLAVNLVGALNKDPFLEKNRYIMRCMTRGVLEIADIYPPWNVTGSVFDGLKQVLNWDPKENRMYNHFLFEAVATLFRLNCEQDPCGRSVANLLKILYPITMKILGGKARELYPYIFQLLGQLVDLNRSHVPLPKSYMHVLDKMVLGHDLILWKQESGPSVWGLSRLLQSYLEKVPDEVNKEGRLRIVVDGIINKLVSSPTTEEEGFRLLNIVIESYGYDVIAEYMNQIWASVFTRLEEDNNRSKSLVRCVMVFMSLFVVKYGVQTLVDLVGVNLFNQVILPEFWIPNLKTINNNNYTEVKLCTVASTKLLFESASLLDFAAEELWGKLLDAVVTLLTHLLPEKERKRVEDDDDDDEEAYLSGCRLRNAVGKKKKDWDLEFENPKQFLVGFPEKVSDEFSGKFPLAIMRHLSTTNHAALLNLCNSYNIKVA